MSVQAKLSVLTAPNDEIYKDLVRIPLCHRGGLSEGRICKISVGTKSVRRSLRGWGKETDAVIQLDMKTRDLLGVEKGQAYQFILKPSGWVGQFLSAWHASDPASRLAARLGILGLALGVIGLVVGLLPLLSPSWTGCVRAYLCEELRRLRDKHLATAPGQPVHATEADCAYDNTRYEQRITTRSGGRYEISKRACVNETAKGSTLRPTRPAQRWVLPTSAQGH